MNKRKVCFPILSRSYYGRRKLLLAALNQHPNIELQIVLGGAVLLDKYSGHLVEEIEKNGLKIIEKSYNIIEGGNHPAMAKSACLMALEFVNIFQKFDPDIVIIDGDRFEQLAIAMSAAYLNKTLAHIEGGDLSGNIDESIRHAITKLAHIHLTTNQDSYRRVIKMGEDPRRGFNVGLLDIEYASSIDKEVDRALINAYGVGDQVDIEKPFLMVIYHPVTSDAENRAHFEIVFQAVYDLKMPTIWFWPNNDAGTDQISEAIRHLREKRNPEKNGDFHFIVNLPAEEFITLLKKSACLVGNSSAGIKECSYFGIPVVNIGDRQQGRLRAANVIDIKLDQEKIKAAIAQQIKQVRYPSSKIYYQPQSSQRVVEILANADLYCQKKFYET